jgi:hypothetical protein
MSAACRGPRVLSAKRWCEGMLRFSWLSGEQKRTKESLRQARDELVQRIICFQSTTTPTKCFVDAPIASSRSGNK